MDTDPLKNLLEKADQAAARPALNVDIAGRIIARARRRRTKRRVIAVAALALLTISVIRLTRVPPSVPQEVAIAPQPVPDAQTPNPFDAIVAQKTADAILLGRRQQLAISQTHLDPQVQIQIELDDTAGFLIAAGDRIARDPALTSQADDDYRRVETCFPDTTWAATASERLRQLHS